MDTEHGEMSERRKMRMEWRHHAAMRTLAAVIVIVFVFWCGFQFGEIRATVGELRGGYGLMQGGYGSMGTTRMHTMIPAGGTTTVAPAATGAGSGQQN